MSKKNHLDAFALAATAVCLGVLAGAASTVHSKPAVVAPKSWIHSGKRYSLSSLERSGRRPMEGRLSVLCSAKEVGALAVMNDTLWIGTEGGLFAYCMLNDSISAVQGPVSPSVRSIAFDDGGALWVGGDDGISVRSREGWRLYWKESLPFFERVTCMVQGESRFWIGTYGNGCAYVSGGSLTVLSAQDSLLDDRVLSILEESSNVVYIGTASGLIEADTSGWKSLRYGSRLPIGPVNALAMDEDENLLLAIGAQGVTVSSFGRVRTFGTAQDLPGSEVRALSLDPTGRTWAAGREGVSIFDGSEWAPCTVAGVGDKHRRFLSVCHDESENSYLGSDDGKVLIVGRNRAKEITVPQVFAERRVSRIRSSNGTMWLIAGRRVYSWKGSFTQTAALPEQYADEMTDLAPGDNGELWVTTRFGILHFAGRTWDAFDRRTGLPAEHFTRVARDPAGTLWFAAFDGGIVELSAGKWIFYGAESGLPVGPIDDLALDNSGNPWIVTRNGEVAHFGQGAWARMELPSRQNAARDTTGRADSLDQFDPSIRFLPDATGSIQSGGARGYCIGFDKRGSCLVGGQNGVYRLATTGWQFLALPESMRGAGPTAILGTAEGDIWLGTAGRGALVYRRGDWFKFGPSSGLSDDYIHSMCEDQRGVIWIGTQTGGVARFAPQQP
ncbi:MAG: two-component regulator propeller domain-containing protein [Candidatus Krumholzibacteria bacterium]|nr:two-component regulator propeller domain-containing protein [Candidatus Krumholzibacteria bacterium]